MGMFMQHMRVPAESKNKLVAKTNANISPIAAARITRPQLRAKACALAHLEVPTTIFVPKTSWCRRMSVKTTAIAQIPGCRRAHKRPLVANSRARGCFCWHYDVWPVKQFAEWNELSQVLRLMESSLVWIADPYP